MGQITSEIGEATLLVLSAVLGWVGNSVAGWWKSRDRYQAHVTWQTGNTMYGPQEMPVIVIQSIHSLPINVTRIRIRNGFRWKSDVWPFNSEDPDYPNLPRTIEPMKSVTFRLDDAALEKATAQSRFLKWFWVSRVYLGVETMGRGERLFSAEGGLVWNERRKRYRP